MTDHTQPRPGSPEVPTRAGPAPAPRHAAQPHLSGDLPTILDGGPAFAAAMRGYDRLQVDNYVAWAESELRAAQRLTTELVDRLAASEAEAHRARQLMARSPEDRQMVTLSDRVAGLLRLAAQEAAASAEASAADAAQAQDVLAHAREEAEVVVRRARKLEARAAARLQDAERRLAEARTVEEQTRSRVRAMLHEAAEEQERLEADATARRAQVERELHDLLARRHRARLLLGRLADQVDTALAVLGDEPPVGYSFDANRTATPPAAAPPALDRQRPGAH